MPSRSASMRGTARAFLQVAFRDAAIRAEYSAAGRSISRRASDAFHLRSFVFMLFGNVEHIPVGEQCPRRVSGINLGIPGGMDAESAHSSKRAGVCARAVCST